MTDKLDNLIEELEKQISDAGDPLVKFCHSRGVYGEKLGFAIATALVNNAIAVLTASIDDPRSEEMYRLVCRSARVQFWKAVHKDLESFLR